MKRALWTVILLLILSGLLVACGGGAASPEPAADEAPPTVVEEAAPTEAVVVEDESAPVEESAPTEEATSGDESTAEPPVAEEAPAEEATDMLAGRPTSGIDPETGFEINPPQVIPGVDFIVVGEIMSFNLIPKDRPEFVILSPSGTRYRIHPQPIDQITYEDGTLPAQTDFKRGLPVAATVRQEEGAGATIVVQSSDFTLLQGE